MVNVSSFTSATNMFNTGFVSNPFMLSTTPGAFNFSDDSINFSSNPFSFSGANLGYFNYFSSDLAMFDMFMNNQMPFAMQQDLFTKTYNTNTNLPALASVYNADLGNRLANIAERNASKTNTVGWCARGTNDSLELAGITNGETRVASAYQEADKLAHHKNFKEVFVSREDLKSLPAGCVIVWDKNAAGTRPSDIHGHITITLGDGKEASDHITNTYMLNTQFRVFVPVGINQNA